MLGSDEWKGGGVPVRTAVPLPSACGKGLWEKPKYLNRIILPIVGNSQEASARLGQS